MNACIEEHYKKYYQDFKVIRLILVGDPNFNDIVEMLYD